MDYVVAGFGIGAVLALIGFALWELFGTSDEVGTGWLARAAIGAMLGALVIWAITVVSLVSMVDDSTGSNLVLLTTVVTLLSIAIVSFWYWRVERSLPMAKPEQRAAPAGPVEMAEATPAAEIELSDWDTWPEREPRQEETPEPLQTVSFEPETATEPVAASEATPESAQDIVLAVEAGWAEPELPGEDDRAAEPEHVAAERSDDSESFAPPSSEVAPEETERGTERPARLLGNVRAFRPRPVVPVQDDQVVVEKAPVAPAEPGNVPDTAPEVDAPEDDRDARVHGDVGSDEEAEPTPKVDAAPSAFESSLLADIDSSTARGDRRYQSPLLADLESRTDDLEEIGLAKWRPEDRLTADEPEERPRRRRR